MNIKENEWSEPKDIGQINLRQCWEYFENNCECHCLKPKHDNIIENHLYNLFNFQVFFKELKISWEENRVFAMTKHKMVGITDYLEGHHFSYVSDVFGFGLFF